MHSQSENSELKSLMDTKTEGNPDSEAIAKLEGKIQKLEDERNEERFLCILVIILMIDFVLFTHISNWGAALVIGIIELILIVILARKFGIDEVVKLIDKCIDGIAKRG